MTAAQAPTAANPASLDATPPPPPGPPTVMVRSIDWVSRGLAQVTLRAEDGRIFQVVVPVRLATVENVAITAHAVSSLAARGRL